MAFARMAQINNAAFVYFPRFSSTSSTRSVLAALIINSQESASFDHEFASPSAAGSDEILEQLNDENYYSVPFKVFIEENDVQIQFKRILQRTENIPSTSKFGTHTQNDDKKSAFPQKQTVTRIVKRRENPDAVDQYFPRAQPKPNESCIGHHLLRQTRLYQRGENNDNKTRINRDFGLTPFYCAFCLSNGETEYFYTSHPLKDDHDRVTCPILQRYICPHCGATGQSAHTIKYCPVNKKPLPKCKPIRRNAIGKRVVSYN